MSRKTHPYFGVCHKASTPTGKMRLLEIYRALFRHYGPLHWWPGETPFEVCVGAILTQNTAWANVEKAIANLKASNLLTPRAIGEIPIERLAEMIRPSGYFNQKAKRLKLFARYVLERHGGRMERMKEVPAEPLRQELLAQNGIGPETADSILLYALGKPIFVVDAYTKRIFYRKDALPEAASYDQTQKFFQKLIRKDVRLYNEYHAQIVYLGKDFCRKKNPLCDRCPIRGR